MHRSKKIINKKETGMKIKNGKISTSTMIRLLMKHANDEVSWTASAPAVQHSSECPGGWLAMVAESHGNSCVTILDSDEKAELNVVPWREDWTIHRKGEKPVPENPQFIGEFTRDPGGWMGLEYVENKLECLPEGSHRVYVKSQIINWTM
jgi:hypothetical protein